MVPSKKQGSRKGSIISLEYAILLLIIPLFISAVLVTVLMNFMLDLSIVQNAPFAVKLAKKVIDYSQYLDAVVALSLATITGRIIIKSNQINMHPIFGVVGLIALPGLAITLGMASNIAAVFTQLSIVGDAVNKFPASIYIAKNLPEIGTALAVIILAIMVGVRRKA